MIKIQLIILASLFILFISMSTTALAADNIKEGNRLFEEQHYDDAIEQYNAAKAEKPDSGIANFNLGTALYRKNAYEDAVTAFTRALVTEDRLLEAKAYYNIANSKYRLGYAKMNSDPSAAADLYRESLDYYKRAIGRDKDDKDAKYNHELVEKNLKILLDKIKKQQQNQEQDGENQEQDGEDQKQESDQQKQQQQKNNENQKQDNDKQKQNQEQDAEDQKQESDQQKQQQQDKSSLQESADNGQADEKDKAASEADKKDNDGGPAPEAEEGTDMTPDEARMLLDAFTEERSIDELEKKKAGTLRGVIKDW